MVVDLVNKKRFRKMSWANGRGVTTELYVHKDALSGRMLWRLSIAGVDSDGPFSDFPGYERILVLLEGAGLTLCHGNGAVDRLTSPYELASFPGDSTTQATLTDGPIKDFNLIADRGAYRSAVTLLHPEKSGVPVNARHLAIFAADNDLLVLDPAAVRHVVPQGDLFLVDSPSAGEWVLSGATAIVVQLQSVQ